MKDAIDLGMGAPLLGRSRTGRRLRGLVIAATPALFALAATLLFLSATTEPAAADFRLCNNTASRVGVAVGYKDAEGWTTEGWWNLPSHTCETILKGNLVARFYYVYAIDYDRGGEWMGQAVMCTRDKEFTIRGIADCLARGFDRIRRDNTRIRMRDVNQRVDLVRRQIIGQPGGAAKAARPRRHGKPDWQRGAAGKRKRDGNIGTRREPLGQFPRFGRAAENKEAFGATS